MIQYSRASKASYAPKTHVLPHWNSMAVRNGSCLRRAPGHSAFARFETQLSMWFVACRLLEGITGDLWFLLNRVAQNCMESCIHMNCLRYSVIADNFVNREQGGSSRQVAQVSLNPIWDFSRHGVSRITEIQIVHVTYGSVILFREHNHVRPGHQTGCPLQSHFCLGGCRLVLNDR